MVSAATPFLQNSRHIESSRNQTFPLASTSTPFKAIPIEEKLIFQITQSEADTATARISKPEAVVAPAAKSEPERKPLVVNIIPEALTIPSLEINNVEIVKSYIKEEKQPDGSVKNIPDVPNSGIATPNGERLLSRSNKIIVFGHSAWKNKPEVLGDLENINFDEIVSIKATIPSRQVSYDRLDFTVERKILADIESGEIFLRNFTPEFPTIIIQTTVRENGLTETERPKKWILDKARLKEDSESIIEGDENDPKKYLIVFVIGKLTPESLNRIRAVQ